MEVRISRIHNVNDILKAYGFEGFQASGKVMNEGCEKWTITRSGGGDVGTVISPYNGNLPLTAHSVAMQIIGEIEKWKKSLHEGNGCNDCRYGIIVNQKKNEVICFFDALGSEGDKPCER